MVAGQVAALARSDNDCLDGVFGVKVSIKLV